MDKYSAIFRGVESTIIRVGSATKPEPEIRKALEPFKHYEDRVLSDEDYYRTMVDIVFYSGMRAQTVTDRLGTIHKHFSSYRTVAEYGERKVKRILNDPGMIRNENKVHGCVKNAQMLDSIVREQGSFRAYIESFQPKASRENLSRLRKDLIRKFSGRSKITSYHYLMDIGMPVLKPDRVIRRIFHRLGLIENAEPPNERTLLETQKQGMLFAQAVNQPIRYIDIILVALGQVELRDFGLDQGICLDKPRCEVCGIPRYCHHLT